MNMNTIVDLCEEKPTDELILQVYLNKKNGVKTNYFYRKFLDKHQNIENYLKTRFNDSESYNETIYRILNKLEIRPTCPTCGKPLKYYNMISGFQTYCSLKCMANNKEIQQKIKNTKYKKYGSQTYNNIEKLKQTNLKKYGVEYYQQSTIGRKKLSDAYHNKSIEEKQQILNKIKNTFLDHYGVEHISQTELFKEKYKQTCLEKYGVEHILQTELFKEKYKQTCLDKYGTTHPMKTAFIQNKLKETFKEKYGVEYVFQNKNIYQKMLNTMFDRYETYYMLQDERYKYDIHEKYKQTCLDKYGVDTTLKVKNIIKAQLETRKQHCLEKFGVEYYFQTDEYKQKVYNTKKKNHTFNSSKIEQQFKEYLEQNYPNDFEYQYRSELYPFNCDFYIKSLDLYIEIQGNWTHGKHPFNENNQKDINQLNILNRKNQEFINKGKIKNLYKNAIYTWTELDVKKRKYAHDNNLNYLEIFSNNINEAIQIFEEYIKQFK